MMLLAMLFLACRAAAGPTPTPTKVDPNAIQTSAALTAYVDLTQLALDYKTPTDLPPTALPSETPVPPVLGAPVEQLALQSDGRIIISAGCGTGAAWDARRYIARLNPDGSLDAGFNPALDGPLCELVVQPDDSLLAIGVDGVPQGARNYFARIDPAGTLLSLVDVGVSGGYQAPASVDTLALQPDRKLVVAGNFSKVGGQPHAGIARLDFLGGLDPSFNTATKGAIFALAAQPDGKTVLGGQFLYVNGISRGSLARLNPNGSLDAGFDLPARGMFYEGPKVDIRSDLAGSVLAIALQQDGKIVVAGDFATIGDSSCCGIARLNRDGTLDTAFAPGADWPVIGRGWLHEAAGFTKFAPGMDGPIRALAIQPDGKIVVGGIFTAFDDQHAWLYAITRLNPDGTPDVAFNQQTIEQIGGTVLSLALQPDGKILVGGFLTVGPGAQPTPYDLLRLNPDGSLDTTFKP